MELENPLMAEGDNGGEQEADAGPRSISVSPGDEELGLELEDSGQQPGKLKPMPLPRSRAHTVTVGEGSRKKAHPLPHAVKSSVGIVTTPAVSSEAPPKLGVTASSMLSYSTPKNSSSPVPKPRSGATASKLTSSTVATVEESRAEARLSLEDGRGSNAEGKVSERDADSALGSGKERSGSACSSHSSSSSADKIRASITLQKLLPREFLGKR